MTDRQNVRAGRSMCTPDQTQEYLSTQSNSYSNGAMEKQMTKVGDAVCNGFLAMHSNN